VAAAAAGLVTASVAVTPLPGIGAAIGILATTAAVWPFTRGRRNAELLGWGACAVVLSLVVVVRDASWLVDVDLAAALGLASIALAKPRTLVAHIVAGVALFLAGFKGARWMASGVRTLMGGRSVRVKPWLRSVGLSALLLLVFGLLFSSADEVFSRVLTALTPDVSLDEFPARIAVFGMAALCVLAAGYLLAAAPRFDAIVGETRRRPARIEWVLPLGSLVTMVGVFVTVQIGAWLGGDTYVRQTAGLTYAQYARTGFAQLVAAAVLTLVVIAGAIRWVPRQQRADRLLRNGLLGALCMCTLVVLASAAHRLALYDANYGLTQLRFCVMAAIGWIGAVFLLVLAAGVTPSHYWLPHAILASMVVALLGVTLANPDARVADSLVKRYADTGRIDTAYLATLSADAVPALLRLPADKRACVMTVIGARWHLASGTGGWAATNVARSRADGILLTAGIDTNVAGTLDHSVSPSCFPTEALSR
jgi:hypothetical protein